MILSISYQLKIFLISLFIGLMLGFFYDFLKLFRKYIVHNNILINIEDIIYWIFMSIIIFLVSLYQNNGEIRVFFIIGIFISMLLYNLLISPFLLSLSTKIINLILKIFSLIFKAISMPFIIIFNILYKPLNFIFNILYKPLNFIFNILKKLLQKCNFCVTIYNKIIKLKIWSLKGDKTQDE